MKIRPILDLVWLKRLEPEKKSEGGIIIPATAQEKSQRARVLAVGPGRWIHDGTCRIRPEVKAGDIVRIPYMRGADLLGSGVHELLLHESELLGVEEN